MRLSRASLIMVVASVVVLAARSASAMCAMPTSRFSPPTGTVVPASGTVYLFVIRRVHDKPPVIRLEVDGARFTARRVAMTPVFDVVRIDLAASGREVAIRWKPDNEYDATEVRYPIGVPVPGDAQVTSVSDTHFDWACSHTDTIDVELIGNAIAYRLDWSDGWSDILPADPGGLSQKDALDTRPRQRIRIGFASCLGDTVDPKGLATLRELRLTALFVDGSELRFAPAHARLDGHRVRLPRELQPEAVTATVTPLAPPPLTSLLLHARNEHRPLWPMIGAVAGLAVATSMALRWRVRLSDHVSLG